MRASAGLKVIAESAISPDSMGALLGALISTIWKRREATTVSS